MSNTTTSGKVTGTGAALTVPLGWQPDFVEVFNYNDAGALYPVLKWYKGMPADSGCKLLSITDNGATALKSLNRITAGGITLFAGSATVAPGFTIGTDADINVNGEEVYYVASRNIDGAR